MCRSTWCTKPTKFPPKCFFSPVKKFIMFSQNSLRPFARIDNIVCSKISYTYKKKKQKKNNLPLIAGKVFIVSQKTKTALSSNLLKIPYIHPKKQFFILVQKS